MKETKETAPVDLSALTTEERNPRTLGLDQMTPLQIATTMSHEDDNVVMAVREVLPQVAKAIEWATESLQAGGRIIYFGAGTSGRLGVLDAVECPPTFGVSPDVVVGIIAGGDTAFTRAVEGAEDDETLCGRELKAIDLTKKDLAVGLAASGRTPYVLGGLRFARETGCRTVAIACNKGSAVGIEADLAIEPTPGPEVLTGSTRLKSGTAQKMILNMISTGAMVGIGKVYENLMVDVQQTNEKLVARAQNITMDATDCSRTVAIQALEQAHGHVKCAIVMILANVDETEANARLDAAAGHIRKAIA